MSDLALNPRADVRALLARAAARLRTEHGIVVAALAVVGVHVADDNFVQPAAGTSAADHLASGLVPLAILAAAAWIYPRLRAGTRAAAAMTLGVLGIAVGVPGAYYLQEGHASGDHYTGLLALAAGIALLGTGPVTLWKARRSGGTRGRRYALRARTTLVTVIAVPALVVFVVFPVSLAYIYTHTGKTAAAPALGVPYETVTFSTSDGLELAGSYVPSKNRAAVVLYPGTSAVPEAKMLIRHGYGVLLVDPRGQGLSEGDTVRWAGDRDLLAAAAYVRGRTDVDRTRVGAIGFSIGGEMLLRAAAEPHSFDAVISEGAGERVGEADVTGPERLLSRPMNYVLTGATALFGNHGPPPHIVDRIGRIAPRPVFLIYADPGMGGEVSRQPKYYAAAGGPKTMWKVPGSKHTGGIEAQPAEYERRVIDFLAGALRPDPQS